MEAEVHFKIPAKQEDDAHFQVPMLVQFGKKYPTNPDGCQKMVTKRLTNADVFYTLK